MYFLILGRFRLNFETLKHSFTILEINSEKLRAVLFSKIKFSAEIHAFRVSPGLEKENTDLSVLFMRRFCD